MPKESVRTRLKKAEKLQKNGKTLEAYAEYEAITRQWPANAQANKQKSAIGDAMLASPALAFQPLLNRLNANAIAEGVYLANAIRALFKNDAEIMNISGALHMKQGDAKSAQELFEKAISLAPDQPKFRNNLSALYHAKRESEDAIANLKKAIELAPNDAKSHWRLGLALTDADKVADARLSFARAYSLDPTNFWYHLASQTMASTLHQDVAHINKERALIEQNLDALKEKNQNAEAIPAFNNVGFMLSYHGMSDRVILQKYHALLRANYPVLSPAPSPTPSAANHRKLRVGICSNFLHNHTIGKLFEGHITQLDAAKFERIIIRPPAARSDDRSKQIDAAADQVVNLPNGLPTQQQIVADLNLDFLFDPDLGMSPNTLLMAHARLAPVQAVSWGHPDTTGIPSVDYFLSNQHLEPEGAEHEYSEQLIRLERLPSYYAAPDREIPALGRADLNLPEDGTLYGCPQSLFKFHPDFDQAMARVLEHDPKGRIVLIDGHNPEWTKFLKKRWAAACPNLSERTIILPRMTGVKFMSLLRHCAVLLDPFPFGSGNTMYEAMEIGTPIVTLPGKFMRGRCVYGAYRQMGLDSAPIAKDIDDYARLAVEIANDDTRRAKLAAELKEAAREHLFEDTGAIREFEAFVQAAVQAARSGELLSGSWSASQLSQ